MRPYPELPYDSAPFWCFPAAELSMCLLFALCLVHALKKGTRSVLYLIGGLLFGLTLEYIEVITGSYTYGRFHIMLGRTPLDIPLCIGCGWGIIIYTSRLFSDALSLPLLSAAALDALLALNIDLSMDVVAYRLHMWHWDWRGTGLNAQTAQWFGIPYGNFVGWATVIFCYSLFSRLCERALEKRSESFLLGPSISALLAILCSQIVLFTTETYLYPILNKYLGFTSGPRLLVILVILVLLSAGGWIARPQLNRPIPLISKVIPSWFHFYFVGCFFALGFYHENTWMTAIACINVLLGTAIHIYPWQHRSMAITRQETEGQLAGVD